MDISVLKAAPDVMPYISQVAAIADRNKDAFGFLAASVYEQMALKGQLWIAVNNQDDLKGYLMFGGTMPTVKIFQIYVCPSARGTSVGKTLIDLLKKYAKDRHYHSISARVASDLPANKFWAAMGFAVYRQVPGSKKKKRIINIRGFSFLENDLFGKVNTEYWGVRPKGPVLKKPAYALDLNLLLDVVKDREGYQQVVKIMQAGFQGRLLICVTPELKSELERQSINFTDDPALRVAQALPELSSHRNVEVISDNLRRAIFPFRTTGGRSAKNDEADLRHLAHSISAGIDGFITRDKALLRACNDVKNLYGLAILSPDELLFDDGEHLDIIAPLNADFSLAASPVTEEIKKFVGGFPIPDAVSDLLKSNPLFAHTLTCHEARLDGQLFGVFFSRKPIKTTNHAISALYLDESYPRSIAAIDHFVESMLRHKSSFSYRIDMYIGRDQSQTEETLLKKGFFKLEEHFVKIISNTFLDYKRWPKFTNEIKSFCGLKIPENLPSKKELVNTGVSVTDEKHNAQVFSWFDFETIIGPRFIVTADRDCIIVPIRENYANGLIGNVKNQMSLLSSHDITLLLEKAYFRSCSKASLFKKGGILAFYVSGADSIQEIIAFARITYSAVMSIGEARIKMARQGVLSYDELVDIADKSGNVHVFTFDNFLEFDRRISFSRAKELGLIGGANLVAPEKINIDKFKVLIGEAFRD